MNLKVTNFTVFPKDDKVPFGYCRCVRSVEDQGVRSADIAQVAAPRRVTRVWVRAQRKSEYSGERNMCTKKESVLVVTMV